MKLTALLLTLWGVALLRELWKHHRLGRENDRRLAEYLHPQMALNSQRIAAARARNQRFLDDLYARHAQLLVEEGTVFQTERGSMYGLTVHTRSPERACEALVAKYLQPVRAA